MILTPMMRFLVSCSGWLALYMIIGLACWRATSLIVEEDGPWDILANLRHLIGVRYDEWSESYGLNVVASALTCVWCASIWVGFILSLCMRAGFVLFMSSNPVSLILSIFDTLVVSAVAILADSLINK